MSSASSIALGDIMATKSVSVDPSKFAEEIFDLYSIPAFDKGKPEIVAGREIGSAKQVVEPGDVLLSKIVPHIRRSWIVGKERGRRIIASGEWIVFRSVRANPDYLRQVLVGDPFHAQFMNTVAGVGGSLLRARPAHVAKITIPLPPLAEQTRIAQVLDRAEVLRATRRTALAQLDSLTQCLFLDLFGDPIVNHKGWKTCLLGDIAKKITDGTHKTPVYKNYGIEFLSAKDLKDGGIEWGTGKFISEEEHRELVKRCNPELGDILLAKSGSLGSVAIIDCSHQFSLFESLCLIKHDRERIDGRFLTGLLRAPSMLAHLLGKNKGVAIKHLHLVDIRNLKIPFPPLTLQRKFARRVEAVEKLKAAQRRSLAELNALFATLQYRAFNGELFSEKDRQSLVA